MKHWLGAICIAALPMMSHALTLDWPVECTLGTDCFIQDYPDRDAGPATQDYRCGHAGMQNGHNGVDIRLRDVAAMRDGVAVLAAADGTVTRLRDGVADKQTATQQLTIAEDRKCGNGVVIDHGDGFETQYCHVKMGSIRVRQGQKVTAGDTIASIGLSGFTNFPHLHMTVRQRGQLIDPFDGKPLSAACGAAHGSGLWRHAIAYQQPVLLNHGFADQLPDRALLRDTPVNPTTLPTTAANLIYWVDIMQVAAGDALTLRLSAPDGSVIAERTTPIEKTSGMYFSYIGRRNRTPLAAGTYEASVELQRAGRIVVQQKASIQVQ